MADNTTYLALLVAFLPTIIAMNVGLYPRVRQYILQQKAELRKIDASNPLDKEDFFKLHDAAKAIDVIEYDLNDQIRNTLYSSFAILVVSSIGFVIGNIKLLVNPPVIADVMLLLIDIVLVLSFAVFLVSLIPLLWKIR